MDLLPVSPSKLRDQHPEDKHQSDFQNHFWAYLVVRPLSFYVAPIFIWLGFSANQVTLFGSILLITGLAGLAVSTTYFMILISAFLMNIWYLIDFTDGIVARYYNIESEFGAFFDWSIGVVYSIFLPFSIGILLYQNPHYGVLHSVKTLPSGIWLWIAGVQIISYLLQQNIYLMSSTLLQGDSNNSFSRNISIGTITGAITSFKAPILLILSVFTALDLWLVFYMIFTIGLLFGEFILRSVQIYHS